MAGQTEKHDTLRSSTDTSEFCGRGKHLNQSIFASSTAPDSSFLRLWRIVSQFDIQSL